MEGGADMFDGGLRAVEFVKPVELAVIHGARNRRGRDAEKIAADTWIVSAPLVLPAKTR